MLRNQSRRDAFSRPIAHRRDVVLLKFKRMNETRLSFAGPSRRAVAAVTATRRAGSVEHRRLK